MTSQFFADKHNHLKHDYRDPSSDYSDSCTLIAVRIAELLKQQRLSPHILVLRGEIADSSGNRATLVPLPYDGRVRWGTHIVCEADGVIHDPMLPEPLATAEYIVAAFDQSVDIEDYTERLGSPFESQQGFDRRSAGPKLHD